MNEMPPKRVANEKNVNNSIKSDATSPKAESNVNNCIKSDATPPKVESKVNNSIKSEATPAQFESEHENARKPLNNFLPSCKGFPLNIEDEWRTKILSKVNFV